MKIRESNITVPLPDIIEYIESDINERPLIANKYVLAYTELIITYSITDIQSLLTKRRMATWPHNFKVALVYIL